MTTYRIGTMSITRVTSEGGDPGDSFAEEGRIHGKANNIVLPNIVAPHVDRFGPIGTHREWNYTVELTDFTFDLMDVSEAPESLGPVKLYFDVITSLSNGFRKKHRIGGRIQTPGNGSFDRSTDFPRPITIYPFLYVVGGGLSLQAHQEDIAEPTAGDTAGPFAYVDIDKGIYRTRAVGRPTVEHLPLPLEGE